MSSSVGSKRKRIDAVGKKPLPRQKRSRKNAVYHSSSEDENGTPATRKANRNIVVKKSPEDESDIQALKLNDDSEEGELDLEEDDSFDDEDDEDVGSDAESGSEGSETNRGSVGDRKKRKRNDPNVFATSISKILDSKLSTAKRADPVLSRSKEATTAAKELIESRLEAKAKRKLRDEKRTTQDRGRVKDVLGLQRADVSTADTVEKEKRLQKTAQRGVVKLFNAVRAAQVKAEEAVRETKSTGTVGFDKRQERVNEMTKKGFLDLLVEGGKTKA